MKNLFIILVISFTANASYAGEGMWLPLFLKSLNESEMQDLGMKITAEDVYSVNKGSLKDAIVHFGGFCTSEIISSNGLLLTNHHCGYGQIQSHSSIDNNYLKNGFWAMNQSEELENPGLSATFINEIIDVSVMALEGVTESMTSAQRQAAIDINLESIKNGMVLANYQEVSIKPFYNGNQYFAFVKTTYRDIRLVGAPPESIGKFGADTDNWVWPRHTGDFALFRIYAGPDNLPADPSPENKPYQPKHYLPVSTDGVSEGDFTLIFGFPGRTQQYLPSPAVKEIVEVSDPAKIEIREKALNILDKYMRKDEATKIQYSSKFARIANYWKKWIGEVTGLKKSNAMGRKEKFEKDFLSQLPKDSPSRNILPEFDRLYKERAPYSFVKDYYGEVTGRNIELMRIAGIAQRLVSTYEKDGVEAYEGFKGRVIGFLDGFYKDYNPKIDMEVFAALTALYAEKVDKKYTPAVIQNGAPHVHTNYAALSEDFYNETSLTDKDKMMAILDAKPETAIAKLKEDPVYQLSSTWKALYNEKAKVPYDAISHQIDSLQRVYMAALMEAFPDKRFYPDANSTMRVTYGQVASYSPTDAVTYKPVTYLDGVIEKYKPADYEFDVDKKLLELYEAKDFGPYADRDNGKMPVCFIGTNHTTGGNSGSPAIDAHGNLIGLNFDRAWEGTMSDINYDPSICRNIMVDARYILFIIDKFAGAKHLVDEMTLVRPKNLMSVTPAANKNSKGQDVKNVKRRKRLLKRK